MIHNQSLPAIKVYIFIIAPSLANGYGFHTEN